MGWFNDLFKRPLPELPDWALDLDDAHAQLNRLKQDHSNLLTNMQEEYQTLSDLRVQVGELRRQATIFENSLNYKRMKTIIENQSSTNAALCRMLQETAKRAEDEAVKRVTGIYYDVQTNSNRK